MDRAQWKGRFFTIWVGQAFSLFGSSLVDFALIWWLTDVTGSERVLVVSTLATLLPRMALGPLAGALIDRIDRKRVMIAADGAIALVTIGLLAAFHTVDVGAWMVIAALLLRSMGAMFHHPAMLSATALLVPGEHLARVGGLNRVLTGAMTVVSPVAGAFFVRTFGAPSALWVDILTAAVAIAALATVRIPRPAAPAERKSVARETLDGFRYVVHTKGIFFVVGTCTLANVCIGPAAALQPLLVTRVFGGGVLELSQLAAMAGVGLALGGLLMGAWGGFRRNLITSGLGWGGVGAAYIAISLLPGGAFGALLGLMLAAGISSAVGSASLDAFYQTAVPHEYHGRVFSVLSTLDNATVPIGLLVAAAVADRVPIQLWYGAVGVSHLALCLFWLPSARLRRAEEGLSRGG